MWKMATRNEWDESQYHSKENWNDACNNKRDRKHNNVNTNDDVDTPHFDDRVAHHNMHWACTHCFKVFDHHTHIHGSSWVLHFSPHLHANGGEDTYLHTGYDPRPMISTSSRTHQSPFLQDPCRGPGRGWPDTRQDAHWSVPRTSRLLRTRRRVSQLVVVVCKVW